MKYKQRPGIVLAEICGEQYLIPTRAASESCPYMIKSNVFITIIWGMIGSDQPVERIYHAFQTLSRKPEDVVRKLVDRLLTGLCRKGVLIAVEDEE